MQEDLEGVEIPDNPDYGYDEAYNDNYRLPQGLAVIGGVPFITRHEVTANRTSPDAR